MNPMKRTSDSDPRTDQELVDAANAGDVSAFEVIYYRYRDWAVRLAYRFTGNHDDALDVLQETFAYLAGKFPSFRLTAAMTTFLYPVVKNFSIAASRKRRRYVSNDELLSQAVAPTAKDAEVSRSELAAVMASLPEGQREALLMRFVDGMTLEEAASALGIPMGTVKSRIHNALKALRQDERTRRYFQA